MYLHCVCMLRLCVLMHAEYLYGQCKKHFLIVASGRERMLEYGMKRRLCYTVCIFVQIEFFAMSMFYFSSEKKNKINKHLPFKEVVS